MLGKKFRLLISLIVFILIALGYFLYYNWEALFNIDPQKHVISIDSIQLINWENRDNRFISKDDPQIITKGINNYVEYFDITAELIGELDPQIYFTNFLSNGFSEINTFKPTYYYDKNILHIQVDKYVNDLRIDLTPYSGLEMTIIQAERYPEGFVFDFVVLFIWLAIAASFLLLLSSPIQSWRNLFDYFNNFIKYNFLLSNLVRKDITTKYRRSVLGILWSVLNPLLMMLVMSAVFQHLFQISVPNFPIYYLTGSLIFNFNSEATNGAMSSIVTSGPLIRKIYIPKYLFPLEKCIFSLVNTLFSFVAVLIMLGLLGVGYHWTLLLSFVPIGYVFVFSLGFGMILATLNVFFRDLSHLYGVWVTAWMYLTPVMYPVNILPDSVLNIVKLNPLYYYVTYFREIAVYGNLPDWHLNAICALFALSFLVLGVIIFKKQQDKFILYI